MVFSGSSHFDGFFERDNEYQKWIPNSKDRNFESEWRINIPKNLIVKGFKEVITDEDGEIWFIGEL
jgi:hypothetical protein